ncbi:MAG: HEPN domain-containing protein [Paraclostridium sp.]
MRYLGSIKTNIDLSYEYIKLAREDESVAILLKNNHEYRHSIYYFIQAMEKYIKSKIFTLVNPNLEYFINRNRHHSLDSSIEFLIEVISSDETIRNQVKFQFNEYVFKGLNSRSLHNNLRYPFYNDKYRFYTIVNYDKNDCEYIEQMLDNLKKYLEDLNKI